MGIAALAQSVEQLLRKEKVDSSSPSSGTTSRGLNPSGHFFVRRFSEKRKWARTGACAGPSGFARSRFAARYFELLARSSP